MILLAGILHVPVRAKHPVPAVRVLLPPLRLSQESQAQEISGLYGEICTHQGQLSLCSSFLYRSLVLARLLLPTFCRGAFSPFCTIIPFLYSYYSPSHPHMTNSSDSSPFSLILNLQETEVYNVTRTLSTAQYCTGLDFSLHLPFWISLSFSFPELMIIGFCYLLSFYFAFCLIANVLFVLYLI